MRALLLDTNAYSKYLRRDPRVLDALAGAGIAPEKLTKITGLLRMEKGWDEAVRQFQ